MKVLTIGERVRYFRKLLDISQKELADNKVSSNLISLIERGKIPLSTVTASILVDNINRFSEKQGVGLNLGIKDLLMPREEYLRSQCEDSINKSNDGKNSEEYKKIIEVCSKHNFNDVLVKVEEKLADEYFSNKDYKNAAEHYKSYIDSENNNDNIKSKFNAMYRISICCYNMEQYGVSLKYMNEAYEFMEKNNIEADLGNILYQIALMNFKIRNFKYAEEYINRFFLLENSNEELKNRGTFLRGNLYLERGQYYDALKVYKSLVGKEMMDADLLYCNISNALEKVVPN
ncbi:MAG: helix-turn-helix transcriptional regulator [Clostridium sp.]